MTNRALSREAALPTIKVEWGFPGRGAVGFDAIRLATATAASEHPALRTGPNVDRTGRAGLFAFVMDDLSGGFRALSTIGSYGFDKTFSYENEGVMTHIPGIATLSYALTSQASVISGDFTGYNAGNRRVHSVNWATATGQRFIAGVGPFIIKDTSVSDPALIPPATADAVTDDVLSMWTGPFSTNSQVLIIGTDGQTDDIKYTTDPTADTISWTSLVTFANANDRCWWGGWFPQTGNGWHIFGGKINDVPGVYAFKPTDSAPLTISTLAPVVYEDTKDIEGSIAVANTGAISPARGWSIAGSGDTSNHASLQERFASDLNSSGSIGSTEIAEASAINSRWSVWSNAGNITASDDADASATYVHAFDEDSPADDANIDVTVIGPIAMLSDVLVASGHNLSSIPDAAIITGIEATAEVAESNAADNITWWRAQLVLAGSLVGENRADGTEPGTSDASKTFGGSTDRWGLNLRGEEINSGQLGFGMQFVSANDENTAGKTGTITVDHSTLTVYYRFPGTQMAPTQGGFGIGPMPSEPNTMPVVEPLTDQETAITQQRVLRLYRFSYDAEGDRPVGRIENPPVAMGYVGIAAHFQGGVVVIGGNNSTVFNECKLVDSEGIVRNLNMPKTHAGVAITAVKAIAQGNALLVWVSNVANTDAQLWMFFDGAWHALGPLQSKSASIAQRPLYWAETVNSYEQSQGYLLIPNSTTSLMGTRQFIPPGLFDDPAITNTSQLRQSGPLSVTTPILDMGTIETIKALLTLQAQSFQLDDDTLYGSARLEIDTTGDQTFATPAVDVTFGTDTGDTNPFVDYNVVEATNKPGVLIPTATMRLTLDNEASTAKSPMPLPIVFWMTGIWPQDSEHAFFVPNDQNGWTNNRAVYERLITLSQAKPVQRLAFQGLDGGTEAISAAFLDAQFEQSIRMTTKGPEGKPITQEYRGTIFRFRSMPGGLSA